MGLDSSTLGWLSDIQDGCSTHLFSGWIQQNQKACQAHSYTVIRKLICLGWFLY